LAIPDLVARLLAGLDGTVGLNGVDAEVDIGFDQILENLDMVFAARVEARKGRFGIYGELIYLSLSDGAQFTDRLINNTRVQVDEYLADAGVSWRLVDNPRYSIDLVAGSRYTNLYQRLDLSGNTPVITASSQQFVTEVSDSLRDRLNNVISESTFIGQLQSEISARVTNQLIANLRNDQRSPSIPIAPLGGRHPEAVAGAVENVLRIEEVRIRAEVDALGLIGAAREAAVAQRVAARQTAIAQEVATRLQTQLDRSFAKADFWFDPYVGLRGRYNISKAFTPPSAERSEASVSAPA
jgi:outer membrane lipopolysaccharide assembly protein LptE/RlpB